MEVSSTDLLLASLMVPVALVGGLFVTWLFLVWLAREIDKG